VTPGPEADRVLLAHMRECLDRIHEYTNAERSRFETSRLVQDAVVRNLQTLAESSQRLSNEIKSTEMQIPWRELGGFRNLIVHGYLGVDLEAVWLVVEQDLPALSAAVSHMIGGAIDIHITSITATQAHIKSGKLRVLGVMDARRLPQVPDAPTFKESGYDLQASLWYAMSAPAGTPAATLDKLNQALNQVMKDPEFTATADTLGMEPRGGSVDEVKSFIARETDVWLPIFKGLNLPKQTL
jgi:uncharacterized protein with HEPN domain